MLAIDSLFGLSTSDQSKMVIRAGLEPAAT